MEETANAATVMIIVLLILVFAVLIMNIIYHPVEKTNEAFDSSNPYTVPIGD